MRSRKVHVENNAYENFYLAVQIVPGYGSYDEYFILKRNAKVSIDYVI